MCKSIITHRIVLNCFPKGTGAHVNPLCCSNPGKHSPAEPWRTSSQQQVISTTAQLWVPRSGEEAETGHWLGVLEDRIWHRLAQGMPHKRWLLGKHWVANHSVVTSTRLRLPPIHSCYPLWLTVALFESPAKPQTVLLLSGVQLDGRGGRLISTRAHGSESLALFDALASLSQCKPLQVYRGAPLPLSLCVWYGPEARLLASDD